MGFVGSAAVILLFIIFIILGMYIVRNCNEPFGKLLAAGIVLTIAMQAAINIGVVTVVLPTKGLPLPFVSAGGTSMLLSAAAVGILLNIARQSSKIPIAVSTDSLQDDTVQSPSSPAIQTPPPPLHRRHRRHPTTQDNSEFTPGKTSEGQ
jgi:cell division protein FtsW